MSTLILFFKHVVLVKRVDTSCWTWVQPWYLLCVLVSVKVILSLYVECRPTCHFPDLLVRFWLCCPFIPGAIGIFFPFHDIMLIDFLSPVLMSDRNVDFGDSLRMLSYSRSFPSNPSLRKSSIIKEQFSIWFSMSAVFFSRTKLCFHRKFQVFEIQVLVQQLLRL